MFLLSPPLVGLPPSAGSVDRSTILQTAVSDFPTPIRPVIGAALDLSVPWLQGAYLITFTESGLPSGTLWAVTLGGTFVDSTNSTIVFTESNGTYSFEVGPVPGYAADPLDGSVSVAGAADYVAIVFTVISQPTYAITFTETGLPARTNWSVYLNGQSQNRSGNTIVFNATDGTYTFSIVPPPGYAVTSSVVGNTIRVNGTAVNVAVTFSPVGGSSSTTNQGFLGPLAYGIIGGVAALATAFLAVALYLARRKRPS